MFCFLAVPACRHVSDHGITCCRCACIDTCHARSSSLSLSCYSQWSVSTDVQAACVKMYHDVQARGKQGQQYFSVGRPASPPPRPPSLPAETFSCTQRIMKSLAPRKGTDHFSRHILASARHRTHVRVLVHVVMRVVASFRGDRQRLFLETSLILAGATHHVSHSRNP